MVCKSLFNSRSRGVARIFQRGVESHDVKVRVLTRLSWRFRHLLWVICFKKAREEGGGGEGGGHGHPAPRTTRSYALAE